MIDKLNTLLGSKPRVLILGFGREGRSTFRLLRKYFPGYILSIADQSLLVSKLPEVVNDLNTKLFLGENYLDSILSHDLIFKSPGISLNGKKIDKKIKITSQTDIFLSLFSKQTIGVTGTKGKSTTVSLIYHFLKNNGKKAVLLGNIGVPPFDKLDEIQPETLVVFEMSAHQLQLIHHSPHIAVLLNLFPEHLDHFSSLEKYFSAKMNIGKFQENGDTIIVEEAISSLFPDIKSSKLVFGPSNKLDAVFSKNQIIFSTGDYVVNLNEEKIPLVGEHNLNNLMAAMLAANEAGVGFADSLRCLPTFKTLPHRLEYVGNFGGINFYNDSISTVPESAIAAVKSLTEVDTLILGGFDRGINYEKLIDFVSKSDILNLIFLGKAGDEMLKLFGKEIKKTKNFVRVNNLQEAFQAIKSCAKMGSTCLLSPAAASYDQFHNFEHRGDVFKELARNFS